MPGCGAACFCVFGAFFQLLPHWLGGLVVVAGVEDGFVELAFAAGDDDGGDGVAGDIDGGAHHIEEAVTP